MIIDYDDPTHWPPTISAFLEEHHVFFADWFGDQTLATGPRYDALIWQLSALLRPHEILAWHCTRLREPEAAMILKAGMELPSVDTLTKRINAALADGAFGPEIAESFRLRHQADSLTRAGRIWFLFTRPRNDDGVQDFFRFWGGESLYAAIDRDPILGPVLRSVGTPSIVEAAIPMTYFQDSLGYETDIARQYCPWRAGRSAEGVPHDRAVAPIPPECIRRIIAFLRSGIHRSDWLRQLFEAAFP
ncbi:hypothetical protein QLH51_04225 [Sphingomonas sp. 2R-10]|uniref:hypothetical protein n=1 Tax=Sphingomonas sp. 2R-10 TaxID=3045148 RepID=UPI0024BA0CEA|nr:hypothetical protein [Sphingomonas sp. 2R-10]MDJ0276011.1 hypothetical protein [Sphingomonas sp. 2R-10]